MYKKIILANGIRLIKIPEKSSRTATMLALFGVGSRDEKGKTEGMAHFLEHMLLKGTKKRPSALDISKELDSIGASYNAFTGKEFTGFWAQTDKKDFCVAIDVISDIILHSIFDKKEMELEKGAVIEEINMYEDAPMRNIPSIFESTVYNGQALAHDELGNKDNVKNFSQKGIVDFYKKYYTANNLVIAIAGNFDEKKIEAEIKKSFASLKDGGKKIKRVKTANNQKKPCINIRHKKTDQTNFSLGFRAFANNHKDEYVLQVIDMILGGNSSSRLYSTIREKSGLAYYIHTYTQSYQDTGYITVQAGVGNDKLEKVITMVINELDKIKNEKIPAEEIEGAKNCIKGKMAIALESSRAIANFTAFEELETGKILTPEEKFDKINEVTAEDLQRVAQKIFTSEQLNLALIGPFKDSKKIQKLLKI